MLQLNKSLVELSKFVLSFDIGKMNVVHFTVQPCMVIILDAWFIGMVNGVDFF